MKVWKIIRNYFVSDDISIQNKNEITANPEEIILDLPNTEEETSGNEKEDFLYEDECDNKENLTTMDESKSVQEDQSRLNEENDLNLETESIQDSIVSQDKIDSNVVDNLEKCQLENLEENNELIESNESLTKTSTPNTEENLDKETNNKNILENVNVQENMQNTTEKNPLNDSSELTEKKSKDNFIDKSDINQDNLDKQLDEVDKTDSIEKIESKENNLEGEGDILKEESIGNETQDLIDSKEKLEKIKDMLENFDFEDDKQNLVDNLVGELKQKLIKEKLNSEKEKPLDSEEDEKDFDNINHDLLNKLKEIPSFESRSKNKGYAIDTDSHNDIPDTVIKTLILKFLNQRFTNKNIDLNVRSNSLQKQQGFYKWDTKEVVKHLQTSEITKVLSDKYGYKYDDGQQENIPLSFYFDLSGSMSEYTNLLSTIVIELIKKNVKVLIGFNEKVNYQIDCIDKNLSVAELASLLEQMGGMYSFGVKTNKMKYNTINRNLDNYLIKKQAEKCVVFSDFDPLHNVINLSKACNVYWFCFEKNIRGYEVFNFNGFLYPVQNIKDLIPGLIKISEYRFETLCYLSSDREEKTR
ncbi:MAG: hypothetical protein R3Y13_02985 [bacterium]